MNFDIQKDEFTKAETIEHLMVVLYSNCCEEINAEDEGNLELRDQIREESLQYLREYITHLFRQNNTISRNRRPYKNMKKLLCRLFGHQWEKWWRYLPNENTGHNALWCRKCDTIIKDSNQKQ